MPVQLIATCERTIAPDARSGGAPDGVHIFPSGKMRGRDGREFTFADPAQVIAAFASNGADLPVDYDHQNDKPDPKRTGPIPAAGWIKELKAARDGLWGRIEWTARAAELINAKEYRYISPSFLHLKDGGIVRLKGAGLVQSPNLHLTALAAEEDTMTDTPPLMERIAAMLDLPPDVDVDTLVAAIETALKAAKDPDPAKYAPVEAVAELLRDRNSQLATMGQTSAKAKVDVAFSKGFITPAMRPWAIALCSQDEGSLDSFIAKALPVYAHLTKPARAIGPPPGSTVDPAHSAELLAVCEQLGLPPGSLGD
jgi:phage I-like protein